VPTVDIVDTDDLRWRGDIVQGLFSPALKLASSPAHQSQTLQVSPAQTTADASKNVAIRLIRVE
jgi:hypothetical protein